eukprot:351893-Chlamydomonas_euryale.AAC.24
MSCMLNGPRMKRCLPLQTVKEHMHSKHVVGDLATAITVGLPIGEACRASHNSMRQWVPTPSGLQPPPSGRCSTHQLLERYSCRTTVRFCKVRWQGVLSEKYPHNKGVLHLVDVQHGQCTWLTAAVTR